MNGAGSPDTDNEHDISLQPTRGLSGSPNKGDNPLHSTLNGSNLEPNKVVYASSEGQQRPALRPMGRPTISLDLPPISSKRSPRLGGSTQVAHEPELSQVQLKTESRRAPRTTLPSESDEWESESLALSVAPFLHEERVDYPQAMPVNNVPKDQTRPGIEVGQEVPEEQHSSALDESADPHLHFDGPSTFSAVDANVPIPSPLAHSLLYRTRDIANPLNLANFLAEGQEWLIPGTGGIWEGLGRRVDSLFSGLFLKTASILPNYKRNVIICYREYKPSMWIEMFGLRNQFLRHLASLFQGTHRMQSVYLRNLGMEIFEVPPLWRMAEFIATVLKLKNFVSHVYTDHLVTDFDQEVQAALMGPQKSKDAFLHAGASENQDPSKKRRQDYLEQAPFDLARGNQNGTVLQESAPYRRLEVMTNDPFTWQQWAIVDSGPSRWGIEAPTAWDVWTGLGLKPRFTVAVIDSGVDYEHPDLKNQIWRNPDEICGNGIDDDFNGFVDDCIGWDFVKGTNMPMDDNGHGTASAGIIAAEPNNGIGLTGLCWGCDILVLKALNEDIKGTISAFARSLDYAIGKGIVLSNNSYGGRGSGFRGLEEAVQRARKAGMIVVAAAGNYNGNNDNDKQPVYPASYDLDNVVSVAAISRNGHLAPFSSYGKKQVDVAAPGANIMTTSAQKSYRSVSGTSFAVPMVTGTLALLWTRRPHLTYRQVIQRLLRSVKKNPHLEGMIATEGTVDAWSTLAKEDSLDPYAARPVVPVTCASASCSPFATCTDAQGTAKCVCNHGFEGDGKLCKDIDECVFSPCGPASECINTVGSYQCKCRKGFQQTKDACIDIDECTLGSKKLIPLPCPLQARCFNFSGTFDCICPSGTAWNGIPGPAAQCLRIRSPGRGPCTGNGACGVNALCQAFFTPEPKRKCECVNGFKPLRLSNPKVAAAVASSRMSSFDSTVCIREDVLPEEQAYYIVSMHRERLRYLREAHATGRNVPARMQSEISPQASFRTGQAIKHNLTPLSGPYIPTPLTSGRPNNLSAASSAAPVQVLPATNQTSLPNVGRAQLVPRVTVPMPASNVQPAQPEKQQVAPLAKSSCLLGVCF